MDLERQESVFIGLEYFCLQAEVLILCHFPPRKMKLSRGWIALVENVRAQIGKPVKRACSSRVEASRRVREAS
jgi:hypothetical protein